jgi:hypothetical protein
LRQQAPQHSCGGEQQSPPSQQELAFTFVLARPQHSWGGLQQSPPGQQSVAFAFVTAAKQHACGGLQHSAPGAQQLIFASDTPPPRTPRSRAKGASNLKDITDLQVYQCERKP